MSADHHDRIEIIVRSVRTRQGVRQHPDRACDAEGRLRLLASLRLDWRGEPVVRGQLARRESQGGASGPPVHWPASPRAVGTRSVVTAAGVPTHRRQHSPVSRGNTARLTGTSGSEPTRGPPTNRLPQASSPPQNQMASSSLHGPSHRKRSRYTSRPPRRTSKSCTI